MNRTRRRIVILPLAVLMMAFGPLGSTNASAAAINCATPDLINAIAAANVQVGGGTVTLASGCTYTLASANNATDGGTGLPVITGNVTVAGSGATITRSSATGTPAIRIFDVAKGGKLSLDSITLSNGLVNDGKSGGGAIYSHGTLVVTNSTFSGNSSPATTGTSGGAINNSGQLTVSTTTFVGNLAMEGGGIFNQNITNVSQTTFLNNTGTIYGGGAILNGFGTTTVKTTTFVGNTGPGGGAIDNDTTLVISNSTFYNNTGGSNGGGALQNFGNITISQSTLSGNTSQYGANIHNYGTSTIKISSTIVANGVRGSNCGGPPITDMGYNLDTGTSCGFKSSNHSLNNTQPQLSALAFNGGPTQTMALAVASPAVDAIPSTVSGCSGTTDQRGVTRPQGPGCDIGAFEVIKSTGDTQPPTTPTGLAASSVLSNSVTLRWSPSTDNVGVTGYTVYRNGTAIGSTGAAGVTNFTDQTAAPSTVYSYSVDAFDAAGNHSPKSAALPVTTPAPTGIQATQGEAVTTPTKVTSITIPLTGAVRAGDLLVGWFGQYDAAGQVQVSDNVNGAWTRSASTTFSSGAGDLALYYVQNAAASPFGVTVTIAASTATYLEGAASDYMGIAAAGALDQVLAGKGVGTAVDSGATAAVGTGELVVGGIITGGSPGSTTPGVTQGQTFTVRAVTTSGSAVFEDVLSSVAGAQDARATLTTSTDWYAVAAVFHQYGSGDTQPPTTPTGLATTSVTSSSAALSWNASTDNVGVSGYTVYRNGVAIATTGGSTTAYTDSTVAPSTTYSYTVDAFDTAGNHSPQSTPLSVTTPAPPPPTAQWIQGGAVGTGSTVTSTTLSLSSPVHAGDLLVGWFGQYNSSGQVQVSDSVNGAWTRGGGTLLFGSSGDIALYYFQNSAAAPGGLTITISATAATYLQGSASEFSNIALTNSLDQLASASGTSTAADSGMTGSVAAGELLYSGFMTGTSPGSVTAAGGLTIRDQNGSSGVDDASMLVTTAGPQHAPWTLQTSADWYLVAAAFHTVATTIPSPTNVTATAASSTQVNVGWSTGGGTVSSFTVYRNGLAVASVSGSTFTWSDTTVAPSTTYTYGVDAVDGGGNHSARATAAPVTTPSDTSPPTIPAGVGAAALSDTSIKVTWSASADNVGVTGYTVFRGGTKLGTVGATTLAYTDSGLTPATAYTYTVDAFDAAGNHSAQSTAAGATTLADTSPPTTPTNLTATASGSSTVNLTWSASSDDVAVVGYTVYRNGTQVATTNGQTLAYSDTGLTPSTTYGYTVDAFDAAGNHSTLSTQASATTAAASIGLAAPGSLTATAASATQINLTWTASTGGSGVAGYTIYRNSVQVGTVAGTVLSYSDSPLAPSTSYTYTVDAFDSTSAHSPQSAPASATTLADTTPPSVPGGVSAAALSSTQIKVSWSASTDNVAVTGYTVYRNGTQVGTVGGGVFSFTDGGLNPSTLYSYTVDAFDAAANHSAQSAAATATTSGTPKFVQGNTVTTGGRVTSVVLTLSSPVAAGDLLVGFFGQYDVPGQVSVSDNVNGAWTRSASTTWQGGSTTPGDVALYYLAHSAAAPSGLTITISSPTGTYLQGGADEYSGVAATNPLDQVAINKGSSTSADSGATAAVAAGELVYGGMIASNGPGTLVAGTGFVKRAQSGSGSQGEEDILSSAAGPQHAGLTFPTSTQWFMVCATFKAA